MKIRIDGTMCTCGACNGAPLWTAPVDAPKLQVVPTGTARVFIHPRCLSGPAMGAMASELQNRGLDMKKVQIGPPSPKGYCELVTVAETIEDGTMVLDRLDGTRFHYKPQQVTPTRAA